LVLRGIKKRRRPVAADGIIARLGGWEGYEVAECLQQQRGSARWCVVRLSPLVGIDRRCSGCGEGTRAVHDLAERRVRDLPLFEHRVELIVPRVRVACGQCGPKLEQLAWLAPYARLTRRLADSVARLCRVASILHVARFFELDWKTWRSWYRKAVRSRIGPLMHFARRLRPYAAGILAHCRFPLGTNLIEGINNKIKVIKRMAYGYRDDAYFFLKIRAAFPGNG